MMWLLVLLLSSCSTSYQSNGFSGGYSETRLSENKFIVSFRGNGYTSTERAVDYTFLRSAELATEHGFSNFVVVSSAQDSLVSAFTTPTQTYTNVAATNSGGVIYGNGQSITYGGQIFIMKKPTTSNMIICFKAADAPVDSFNAEYVAASVRKKYHLSEFGDHLTIEEIEEKYGVNKKSNCKTSTKLDSIESKACVLAFQKLENYETSNKN